MKKQDKDEQRSKVLSFLKRNRRKAGWTNREIGERLGIEHSTVSARRNELAKKELVVIGDTCRRHNVKKAYLYRSGYPVSAV